jgi:hypothetical protein
MRATYADILQRSEHDERLDRVTNSPLLGFVLGTGLALLLWSAIGWLLVSALA